MEGMRLRVKDVEFYRHETVVRNGKGAKDRVVMLPRSIEAALAAQLRHARNLHESDLAAGYGAVWLPNALARKYQRPASEWAWQ